MLRAFLQLVGAGGIGDSCLGPLCEEEGKEWRAGRQVLDRWSSGKLQGWVALLV